MAKQRLTEINKLSLTWRRTKSLRQSYQNKQQDIGPSPESQQRIGTKHRGGFTTANQLGFKCI